MSLMQPPPSTASSLSIPAAKSVVAKWMRCEALTGPEAVMVADLSLRNRIEQLASFPVEQRTRIGESF